MLAEDTETHRSRISLIEIRIEEIARTQMLMLQDVKKSLENFVVIMRILTIALIVELLIQAMLMSVLILKDSPKNLTANKQGFSITGP